MPSSAQAYACQPALRAHECLWEPDDPAGDHLQDMRSSRFSHSHMSAGTGANGTGGNGAAPGEEVRDCQIFWEVRLRAGDPTPRTIVSATSTSCTWAVGFVKDPCSADNPSQARWLADTPARPCAARPSGGSWCRLISGSAMG